MGPFTGPVHRFVVDRFSLPLTTDDAKAIADDLDGRDDDVDNQLGGALIALSSNDNLTLHGADMVAAGVIASVVEIQADDLQDDPTVSVRYLGAEGDAAIVVGGTIADGVFRSNRTRTTRVPGRAILRLPVFADADPSVVTIDGLEIDFDPDGAGGLDARIRGGVGPEVLDEAARGLIQMIVANPQGHPFATYLFDTNTDGVVDPEEVTGNSLISDLLEPDLEIVHDGEREPRLSFGFGVHLLPCESGNYALAMPAAPCFDRVRDGDESDVDCGGSCMPCAGGAACEDAADCQTQSCAGTCAAATCSDGVQDGFETGLDCGWNCAVCPGD